MIILGIETSCDETAAAVLQKTENRITILSNIVTSSAGLQAKYGGVIPEQAAREQIKAIVPVIEEALKESQTSIKNVDAIAVTYGPGLIGSLLVGVETAKVLAVIWNKPLIPINHLLAHFYANWISENGSCVMGQGSSLKKHEACNRQHETPSFPCIGLLVSGGHTDLVLLTNHGKFQYLGGTRDDAAGECFDKCARLLKLPYPGGGEIAKLATKGNPLRFNLPRPMINSNDLDFSFSGLKTAVANLLKNQPLVRGKNNNNLTDFAASIEQSIVDVLVSKTIKGAEKYKVSQIIVAGGVASNKKLASELRSKIKREKLKVNLFIPPAYLCTDNAAMIAAAAFFSGKPLKPVTIKADPNLSLDT